MTAKAGSTVYVCMHVCVGVYGVSVREEGKGVREREEWAKEGKYFFFITEKGKSRNTEFLAF